MTVREVLEQAATYIEGGFAKGIRHDPGGACCALGAIENALVGYRIGRDEWSRGAVRSAEQACFPSVQALANMLVETGFGWVPPGGPRLYATYLVAVYNNAPATTAADVAALIRRAAAAAGEATCADA